MAYWINQAGNATRPNWRQFYCDTDSDISNLPTSSTEGEDSSIDSTAYKCCSVGSEALSIESGKVFVLNGSDVWSEI